MCQGDRKDLEKIPRQRASERKALIDRLSAGNTLEDSFAEVFSIYRSPILHFFKRRGFGHEESCDLVQNVFLRAYQNAAQLEKATSFEGWLFRIAATVWCNELRYRSTLSRDADEISIDGVAGESLIRSDEIKEVSGRGASSSHNPLERILLSERRKALRRALLELPDRMRQCMMLRVDQGMSYREISEIMKVSIQTVRKQLFEGRERLKRLFDA